MDELQNHDFIIKELNDAFEKYNNSFSSQFHLKIPKNTIQTVHHYRDQYFPYLLDSVYKSNICYLLQSLDYHLWLYKVFRPALSLENAYFYQQLVNMGIITEAITTALLLNPFMEEDVKDRSLGGVAGEYDFIRVLITKNSFSSNIRILKKIAVINDDLTNRLQKLRVEIRNQVHIQNWEGRLYASLNFEMFQKHLKQFREFLLDLKEHVNVVVNPQTALSLMGLDENEEKTGIVIQYNEKGGYGFIRCAQTGTEYYFHISSADKEKFQSKKITKGVKLRFYVKKGKKGPEAVNFYEGDSITV